LKNTVVKFSEKANLKYFQSLNTLLLMYFVQAFTLHLTSLFSP
jgi:hypothetical protein